MNVGDRIRLMRKPACEALGVPCDHVGVVKVIDTSCERTTVMITFPEGNVYTSALHDDDVEVVSSGAAPRRGPSDIEG